MPEIATWLLFAVLHRHGGPQMMLFALLLILLSNPVDDTLNICVRSTFCTYDYVTVSSITVIILVIPKDSDVVCPYYLN